MYNYDHMSFELERDKSLEPSLIEMTEKAIDILEVNPNGFFLLVEGEFLFLSLTKNKFKPN